MEKPIKIILSDVGFGMRILCNLSPEEIKARKKEVIKNFFESLDLKVDFGIDNLADKPRPSRDLSGYWSYFVSLDT